MKILVTGGAGFIGSHLVDRLIGLGYQVAVIDNLSSGLKENINKKARFYRTDIGEKKIAKIFDGEKPDLVFHLAAQKDVNASMANPIFDAEQNIISSLNLLETCKKKKIRFIYSSTAAVYGEAENFPTSENVLENPLNPYGAAKLAVEKYLHYYYSVFGLSYLSLRYSNVYGPRQDPKGEAGVVAVFLEKLLKGKTPVINGDGRQTRDYIYVSDVVEANIKAMKAKKSGCFNIATRQETDVNELWEKIVRLGGFETEMKHGPKLAGDLARSCLDNKKARKELRWQPKTSLNEGLKLTINWFKSILSNK